MLSTFSLCLLLTCVYTIFMPLFWFPSFYGLFLRAIPTRNQSPWMCMHNWSIKLILIVMIIKMFNKHAVKPSVHILFIVNNTWLYICAYSPAVITYFLLSNYMHNQFPLCLFVFIAYVTVFISFFVGLILDGWIDGLMDGFTLLIWNRGILVVTLLLWQCCLLQYKQQNNNKRIKRGKIKICCRPIWCAC